jgi:hypothetical protein
VRNFLLGVHRSPTRLLVVGRKNNPDDALKKVAKTNLVMQTNGSLDNTKLFLVAGTVFLANTCPFALRHFTNLLDHFSFQKKVGCAITYDTQVGPSTEKKKSNFTQKNALHKNCFGWKKYKTMFFRNLSANSKHKQENKTTGICKKIKK